MSDNTCMILLTLILAVKQVDAQINLATPEAGTTTRCTCGSNYIPKLTDGIYTSADYVYKFFWREPFREFYLHFAFNRSFTVQRLRIMEDYFARGKKMKTLFLTFSDGSQQTINLPHLQESGYTWRDIKLVPTETTFVEIQLLSIYEPDADIDVILNELEIYDGNPVITSAAKSQYISCTVQDSSPPPSPRCLPCPDCACLSCPEERLSFSTTPHIAAESETNSAADLSPYTCVPNTTDSSGVEKSKEECRNDRMYYVFLACFVVTLALLFACFVVIGFLLRKRNKEKATKRYLEPKCHDHSIPNHMYDNPII